PDDKDRRKDSGKSGKQRTNRTYDNPDAVHQLRSKAIQQGAGRQLSQHIGPTEPGKEIAHLHRVQRDSFDHRRPRDRKRDPVSIAEAAYSKQYGDDQITDVGFSG